MPKFSKNSQSRLGTCDKRLQEICEEAIKIYDFTVLEGYRSLESQKVLYDLGFSKVKEGSHNTKPSKAVDVQPYPVPKNDWRDEKHIRRFYFLAGIILTIAHQKNIEIRWGGDWDRDYNYMDNDFDDLFHFEIVGD
jgi:hypothetical protein